MGAELTLDLVDKRTDEHTKFMQKKNPTDVDRTSLREARAAVRRSAKADKSKYYEQIVSGIQHAHDAGDQREVHSNIKKLKCGRTAAVATIVDVYAKRRTDLYRNLLGTTRGDNDVPDSIRRQLSWQLCKERLDDDTQYAWNISTAPPTFEEFEAIVNMCRHGKGINQEQIPGELWQHSVRARRLLWRCWRPMQEHDRLEHCISDIGHWMSANRLKLNMDKTELLWAGTRLGASGSRGPSLQLGADTVAASDNVRVLGVTISSDLSLDKHVTNISAACFYRLRQLRRVRRCLLYTSPSPRDRTRSRMPSSA